MTGTSSAAVVLIGTGAQAKYASEIFACGDDGEIAGIYTLGRPATGAQWYEDLEIPLAGAWEQVSAADDIAGHRFIVCCADPTLKWKTFQQADALGLLAASAIHPRAQIATTASVGAGSIVNAGAVVQPFAKIGIGAMIHANVTVEHDCVLDDFVNLAPGVTLAGWVRVGRGTTVFTGASVIPQTVLGAGCTIGAGAAVIEDVPAGCTAVGVPARIVSHPDHDASR